jgi:saccharopine dehydrogenase-like NADP-dependent oxidoreductase
LKRLHLGTNVEWDDFLKTCIPPSSAVLGDYVGVTNYFGMFVGVEADGHTHT